MAHSSKAIEEYKNGSYYDNIVGYYRYGEQRCPIKPEHIAIFERIEKAKSLWLFHKDDTLTVNLLIVEYNISRAQAYNYLNDAKAIFQIEASFNYFSELMLEKQRIETLLRKAEADPEGAFARRIDKLVERKLDILQLMRDEQERNKPDEQKQFTFIYHMDWTKIPGLDKETYEAWQADFDILEKKARKRFGDLKIEDAEFTDIK